MNRAFLAWPGPFPIGQLGLHLSTVRTNPSCRLDVCRVAPPLPSYVHGRFLSSEQAEHGGWHGLHVDLSSRETALVSCVDVLLFTTSSVCLFIHLQTLQ